MTKPQAFSLTGKKLHVQPTDVIQFSGNVPMQVFLVFSEGSTEPVEIPIKFTPYKHPAFRPRVLQFYL